MRRYLLAASVALAAIVVADNAASGMKIAMRPPAQRAISAEVVIVGKVTAIEKETVDAIQYANAKDKIAFKVAVVKIQTNLAGADNMTHIKIGFVPPPPPAPSVQPVPIQPGGPAVVPIRPRPGLQSPVLKEGQEMLFFLVKHPSANFYVMARMSPPIDVTTDAGKKDLESVKKVTELLADPMKGLKSDKADVRTDTAAALVMKYRSFPEFGGEVDQVAIGAEESKLILQILADADWKALRPTPGFPSAQQAFYQLGLTDKDGWNPPMFPRPQPGQPPVDFVAIQKDTFVKWFAGPGKDYRIKKIVPKAAK